MQLLPFCVRVAAGLCDCLSDFILSEHSLPCKLGHQDGARGERTMLLPTKPLIFLASTAAKAWEPLSVAVASSTASTASTGTPYLFPTALIVCHAGLEPRTKPQSGLLLN